MKLACQMRVSPAPATVLASPLRGEFDAFLYAIIREEASGASLTVLSLLARQDTDPWEEAGDYMRAPREPAIVKLSDILAGDAANTLLDAGSLALAARLLELLPKPSSVDLVPQTRIWPLLVNIFERFKTATRVWIENDRR